MSLLQNLPYSEYKTVVGISLRQCEIIAKLANISISFDTAVKPGEVLVNALDREGFTVSQLREFVTNSQNVKAIATYYKPQSKVAILIGNDKYKHLSKLVTPTIDCDSLGGNLKTLGFIIISVKNTVSKHLKNILARIFEHIPKDSYCFIFYAGHGCEICNTKCMLGVDCPEQDIKMDDCVTENFLLKEVAKCEPDLCILIMDMCRKILDRDSNPQIFESIPSVEPYTIHKNLIIGYATQSSEAAYEVFQIECSTTLDIDQTYEMKTGDTDKVVPGASQYVNVLCTRLADDLDVNSLLDKVHKDVENSLRKQRPIKLQCGVEKRSLYDPAQGNAASLLKELKEVAKENRDYVLVYN